MTSTELDATEDVADRLVELDVRASTVIWTEQAGLVRVRRLHRHLWEFTPVQWNRTWSWLMVGTDKTISAQQEIWTVTVGGCNPPLRIISDDIWVRSNLFRMGAERMLWHAIDYLTWEILP